MGLCSSGVGTVPALLPASKQTNVAAISEEKKYYSDGDNGVILLWMRMMMLAASKQTTVAAISEEDYYDDHHDKNNDTEKVIMTICFSSAIKSKIGGSLISQVNDPSSKGPNKPLKDTTCDL